MPNEGRWLLESGATCCSCTPGPRTMHTWRGQRGLQVAVPSKEQGRGEQRRAEQSRAHPHIPAHESTPGCCCRVPLVHQVELRLHEAQTTARLGAGSSASQLRPHGSLCGGVLRVLLGFMCLFLHRFTLSKKETAASYSASLYPDILKGGKGSINELSYIPKSIFIAELQDQ